MKYAYPLTWVTLALVTIGALGVWWLVIYGVWCVVTM